MTDRELLLRFVLVWAITVLVLALAGYGLGALVSVQVGVGTNILAALLPGLHLGQINVHKTRLPMEPARMWRLAFNGNLIVGLLSVTLAFVEFSLAGENLREVIEILSPAGILALFTIVFVLFVLVSRLSMGIGQRMSLRQIERQRG